MSIIFKLFSHSNLFLCFTAVFSLSIYHFVAHSTCNYLLMCCLYFLSRSCKYDVRTCQLCNYCLVPFCYYH